MEAIRLCFHRAELLPARNGFLSSRDAQPDFGRGKIRQMLHQLNTGALLFGGGVVQNIWLSRFGIPHF